MGTKTRKDGKMVEGVDLYMGGKVGKDAQLGSLVQKGIPCDDLKAVLQGILIEQFGAQLKNGATLTKELPAELDENSSDDAVPAPPATLVLAKSGQEIQCTEADSILAAAGQAGVELDSNCQSGTCGTCMQKQLEGEIRYEGDPVALTDSDRADGMILICIAHPVGRVVIDA
jgi:ferredoxin-nitrite reductase